MGEAAKVEELSFEAALAELETIIRDMESGKSPLEESITAYERGIALKKHCDAKLKEAQAKIDKITIDQNGTVGTEPLDPDE